MKRIRQMLLQVCLAGGSLAGGAETTVQLDKFIVTSQKRVQTIEEVPIPITAYSGDFLARAGVSSFEGLAPLVPGVFIQEQSPNNPAFNIRGITTDSADPRAEGRVSIFQDGVSIGRSRAAVVELFDLERVEVLKGPQGTLFGRGAEIGAISLIQNKAKDETSGELSLGAGDYNERRASGHQNLPLVAGSLFARFAFAYREHDGVIENLADGSLLNGRKTLALRGGLRWQPRSGMTADVIVNWEHNQPPGTAFKSGVIATTRGDTNPFAPAELNRGRQLGVDRTVGGVTAVFEHELGERFSLTSITGWREYDSFEHFDADGSRLPLLEFAEDARGRQFSQELRVNFAGRGDCAGFAGVGWFDERGTTRVPFYMDERQLWPFVAGAFRSGLSGAGVPLALVDAAVPAMNPFVPQANLPPTFAAFGHPALPAPLRGLAALGGAPLQQYRTDEYTQSGRTRAFDGFADGTWRVTPRLELTAGLRITREKLLSGYEVIAGSPPTTLGFVLHSIPGYPYLPTNGRREARTAATSWDGRAAARYEFTRSFNAYASVARGRRPQSLLIDSTTTTRAREETVWNYEAGLKGGSAGGKLQWQASVFAYEYAHFQTNVLSLGRFTVVDAGNATGRGFEFGIQGALSDRVVLFANYAYTDATFDETDDRGQVQQYAGYSFRLTPRHAYSIGATFTLPTPRTGRFFLTPRIDYRSAHFFEDNNAAFNGGLRQPGYVLASLRATWESPRSRWQLGIHADNLFEKEYLADAGNIGGSFGVPTFVAGGPRRIGAQLVRRW